jgi:hypothetical protein
LSPSFSSATFCDDDGAKRGRHQKQQPPSLMSWLVDDFDFVVSWCNFYPKEARHQHRGRNLLAVDESLPAGMKRRLEEGLGYGGGVDYCRVVALAHAFVRDAAGRRGRTAQPVRDTGKINCRMPLEVRPRAPKPCRCRGKERRFVGADCRTGAHYIKVARRGEGVQPVSPVFTDKTSPWRGLPVKRRNDVPDVEEIVVRQLSSRERSRSCSDRCELRLFRSTAPRAGSPTARAALSKLCGLKKRCLLR